MITHQPVPEEVNTVEGAGLRSRIQEMQQRVDQLEKDLDDIRLCGNQWLGEFRKMKEILFYFCQYAQKCSLSMHVFLLKLRRHGSKN